MRIGHVSCDCLGARVVPGFQVHAEADGDSGPTSFDCSGLAQWAYCQIGVTIPRVTDDQAAAGNYVPRDQLQPGDLVFFDGNSHVGLYAGKDQVLHAPDVGQVVRYTDINWLGVYSTARRY